MQIERASYTVTRMTESAAPAKSRMPAGVALAACALLLVAHAGLSFLAARSKSPTYDEPLHALGGWLHLRHHDFRVNPEDPPLWKYWAALPNGARAVEADLRSPLFRSVLEDIRFEWEFTIDTLYPCGRTRPLGSPDCPDSDAFIMRSRAMMVMVSVALGAMIAWWSWTLGGPLAALAATVLFALDPNFLAHGPIVKNDVPLSLVALGLMMAVWRAGIRLTPWNALAIGLLCGAALTVKFSGLVLGPAVAIVLLGRALLATPWKVFRHEIPTRPERCAIAAALMVSSLLISWGVIWAAYGFRYSPTANPSGRLNLAQMLHYTAMNQLIAENNGMFPTDAQVAAWKPNAFSRAIVWLEGHRALPQAWLIGLLYTYQSALARPSFLLNQYSMLGWWYYFPLTMLFKTPLTTLAAAAVTVVAAILARRRKSAIPLPHGRWTWICLLAMPLFFLAVAMRSNLNLGIRHVLPTYPFYFIVIAVALVWARSIWMRWAQVALLAGALGLAAESFAAFPDYLPFFNIACGGTRNGINLLSDSNLDWGQDLKLVSRWQQDHPATPLYLCYFGFADPWAYGIQYYNFLNGYKYGPVFEMGPPRGVLMVSATHLQGVYFQNEQRVILSRLRALPPREVLGGTIYVYDWPPPFPMSLPAMKIPPTGRP